MPNAMHLHILGSGSKGNCSIVESPAGFIMIDNGFSRRETLARMHALGLDENRVRALILTHEHSDHTRGVMVWCKRFSGTLIASAGTPEARSGFDVLPFQAVEPGEAFDIEDVHVQTFPTSHDVVNPMGLRLSCGDDAIGFATDTGTLSDAARNALRDARILALECNHDVHMLTSGDYPPLSQGAHSLEHGPSFERPGSGSRMRARYQPHRRACRHAHISREQPTWSRGARARRCARCHARQRPWDRSDARTAGHGTGAAHSRCRPRPPRKHLVDETAARPSGVNRRSRKKGLPKEPLSSELLEKLEAVVSRSKPS